VGGAGVQVTQVDNHNESCMGDLFFLRDKNSKKAYQFRRDGRED